MAPKRKGKLSNAKKSKKRKSYQKGKESITDVFRRNSSLSDDSREEDLWRVKRNKSKGRRSKVHRKTHMNVANVLGTENEEKLENVVEKLSILLLENIEERRSNRGVTQEVKSNVEASVPQDEAFNVLKSSFMSLPAANPQQKEFDEAGSDYLENFVLDDIVHNAQTLIARHKNTMDQKKIIKWAKIDRELQKFAATQCVTKRIHIPRLIKFIFQWRIAWETIIFVISLFTYGFITYSWFFGYYEEKIWNTVFVIDLIFGFDVIMRLGIEIWRHRFLVPCSVLLVPYSPTQSLLDVLAIVPMERIYLLLTNPDSLKTLNNVDLMRMNRFLRFGRVFKYFSTMRFEAKGDRKLMFILKYMIWYVAFIHFMACVFFYMLDQSPLDYLLNTKGRMKGWMKYVANKPGFGHTSLDQYVLSLGFSTAVVTTVGYGDFFPKNFDEMAVCIAVMLIGAIVLTGNFSSVLTTFELETDGARFDIFHRAKAIDRHLISIKCAPLLRNKINEYYDLLWNYREGVFDVGMFKHLPSSMQEDVLYDISKEMFHISSFFRDLDESFLRAVSRIVRVNLFNPGMILCEEGSYAFNMYYIIQGEVNGRSRLNKRCISTILRPGSIIGEINLFVSCPYETSFETRTACQILQIKKQELMLLFRDYNDMLHLMRDRVQSRLKAMKKVYKLAGKYPIVWAEKNVNPQKKESHIFDVHPLDMRWIKWFNTKVLWDVPFDTVCPIIVEQKCRDYSYKKSHNTCFEMCLIPPIMNSNYELVQDWYKLVIIITLVYAFLGPYCYVFGSSSEVDIYLHTLEVAIRRPVFGIYIIDVLMEIGTACPVTGLYYKMRDGLQVRIKEVYFWIDVAAAFPYHEFDNENSKDGEPSLAAVISNAIHTLKLWKVVRYLKFLENRHPENIFLYRLTHTVVALLYGIHLIACNLFFSACPSIANTIICRSSTWLTSYEVAQDNQNINNPKLNNTVAELANEMPYLLSFFYACATLTSAGFGDFNPKNQQEMIWSIIFQVAGFLLIGYYTAILTSALACTVRPMLALQQKIATVVEFMNHHCLSEKLCGRVTQHYQLQQQFLDGIILPKDTEHLMYDAPKRFTDDVLFQEVETYLDGVPIFTKTDVKILIKIAEKMKRFVVPTNTTFIRRGECRRTLYIVIKGSVAVTSVQSTAHKQIIEASGHFGLRDLLYGEPSQFNIRTLSDCLMWGIDWPNFQSAFQYEEETLDWVLDEKANVSTRVEAMQQVYDAYNHKLFFEDMDTVAVTPSWNKLPKNRLEAYDRCTYDEYINPFYKLSRISRILCKFFFMRRTVHPAGNFALVWSSFISLISCLTIIFLLIEHYMWCRLPGFRIVQMTINGVNWLDIYIRLHWGYFSENNNLLIIHPLKTALKYTSKGGFFNDICFSIPYELIIPMIGGSSILGYGPGATWYSTLRWTRLFQIFRIPVIFRIAHNTFKMRSTVLVTLYVLMTAGFCTALAAVSVYLGCPFIPKDWEIGDEYRMPMCLPDTLAFSINGIEAKDLESFSERLIVGMYYVTQVILVIGYGDMINLNRGELQLTILLMVFGFLITRCIIADITAAEVDSDLIRDEFTGRMNNLLFIMKREKVHEKLIKSVKVYFSHTWLKSRCYQPALAFGDLNMGLKADLFQEFVGERIATIPLFEELSPNALRTLCTYFRKYYFVRGQHIVRSGNMQYDMYIFTKGIIWLLDENSNFVMNLYPGQTFGEVSMIYMLPRKYSVVAGSNVEVLTLSPESYAAVIECYPSIQRSFETKMRQTNFKDLFELEIIRKRIEWANLSPVELKKKNDEIRQRSNLIKEIVCQREPPNLLGSMKMKPLTRMQKFKQCLYGSGARDTSLPIFYFIGFKYHSRKNCRWLYLLHPNCGFAIMFNHAITWYCILSAALVLYMTCFPCVECYVFDFSTNLEYVMWMFIVLQFFMPFQNDEMDYCKNHKEIVTHYLYSPTLFPLDVLTSLPYEYLDVFKYYGEGYDSLKYALLFRLLRLVRFFRQQAQKKHIFSITTFRYKITVSIACFFLMAHFLACLFYFISTCEDSVNVQTVCKPKTWTYNYVIDDQVEPYPPGDAWKWYILSLYWVVTTVSTTGFGDIALGGTKEMAVAVLTIFCGAFVLSVILSHFGAGFASLSRMLREYVYQVQVLLKHTKVIGVSKNQQDNIVSYFLFLWHHCRGVSYDITTSVLPETLRIDVCYSLYSKVIEKSRIFAEVNDKTFIAQVCSRVSHSMCLPGGTIETQGDLGDSLYIVFKGKVAAYTRTMQGQFKVTRGYVQGNIFGVLPAFFYDQEYTNTYRAENFVQLLKLSQSDIYQLAANYPKFAAICHIIIFGKAITDSHDARLEDCIFSEEKVLRKGLFEIETKQQREKKEGHGELENKILD